MVAGPQIQLGEELRAMELVQKLIDHWDREFVLGRLVVERPVVEVEVPGAIGLFDQEHQRRQLRSAGADDGLL